MNECYFNEQQQAQVDNLVSTLLRYLGDQVNTDDVKAMQSIIEEGLRQGYNQCDQYGFIPVIRHLNTALLLCEMIVADHNMVAATLAYNLCRNGYVTIELLQTKFGNDMARLVQGLLNVSQLYSKRAAVENENFHKLLLVFAQDIRVILIMIADRLSLMRQINGHPNKEFVRLIASESRYLYAPLAHRLGLYTIKSELEDLSLKYLNRKVYDEIAAKLNATKRVREHYIDSFIAPIRMALDQSGLDYQIKGRTKSINSIWNKMTNKGVDLADMYDLFAIRIIIDTLPDNEKKACWIVYSIVTDIYTANTSRLKDWITIPKSNGYESLHITVRGPQDKWVEVQIRTTRMDEIDERGVAAHWKYKGVKSEGDLDVWMNNVREVLEAGSQGQAALMRNMNMNLYENEIFVFTPKGDLFKLPQGATVLDFAYHIHTKVGSSCMGAKVDGKNQKINYKLKSGETVEVLTAVTQSPRLDWLNYVVTNRARSKIKQAINERRLRQADLAREALQRRFKNRKIEVDEATFAKFIQKKGYKHTIDFFVAIQDGTLDVNDVVEGYETFVTQREELLVDHGAASEFVWHNRTQDDHYSSDILLVGDDVKGVNYKFSRCCNPIFGDKIVGFIASDGAIKIHRADCGNLKHLRSKYPYRIIRTRWTGKLGTQFGATLRVVGKDDIGIVSSITSVINKSGDYQLRNISIQSQSGLFEGFLVVSVPSLESLDDLIKKIQGVKGVKQVTRL